ncbi:hypothetical protein [Epilithonimonas sp.]|uniref:hypothetical protein n=1 Tax=Epilithonimonas sp. TaxID=2894511 RepID=UPI0028AB2197|nr:hypothetical protein [Epilithonimonas sp.]
MKKKEPELNYDLKLAYKSEWYKYFAEYEHTVNLIFKSISGGEISILSLPLAFLIRHTLELGYKMNLIELEKVSGIKAKIEYKGKAAHKIDDLHKEFESQMIEIFKKYQADKDTKKQFNTLNKKLTELKKTIHKLDELSYAFRYPVKNDGITPNFDNLDFNDKTDVINFKEIKSLFDDSFMLLM